MKSKLETPVLREPFREFLDELFDKTSINETYLYKPIHMSPHTFKKVLRGDESPGSRDRVLINCIVQIRSSYEDAIISAKEFRDLMRHLRRVGGDTIIVASKYPTEDLNDFLDRAYHHSCQRFRSQPLSKD